MECLMIFSIITIAVVTSFMRRQGNPVLLPVEHEHDDDDEDHDSLTQ
jgi:hypothetical protein